MVIALANAPHESLFSTELIVTLMDHFWSRYFQAIIVRCFIPFVIYFLVAVIYFSSFAVTGIEEEDKYSLTTEFFMRISLVLLTFYFMVFDFIVLLREGVAYLFDVFNYIDVASFTLNFYLVYTTTTYSKEERLTDSDMVSTVRTLSALATVLMWFKGFYWMRLFGQTSFYVRLIRETLYDIRYFLILFFAILMTFANALMILNEARENSLYMNFFDISFLNAIMNQYMLSLGEFDTESYGLEGGDMLVWIIFIFTTFITQITFLNMLIAIMGDTFARVSEIKDQSAAVEKMKILADYVIIVRRESVKQGDKNRFIFAITPKSLGQDEAGSWEGTVTQLKKAIDTSMSQIKSQMNKRVGGIQSEVAMVSSKLNNLDDKLNELHGNQQKLPQTKDIEKAFRSVAYELIRGNFQGGDLQTNRTHVDDKLE